MMTAGWSQTDSSGPICKVWTPRSITPPRLRTSAVIRQPVTVLVCGKCRASLLKGFLSHSLHPASAVNLVMDLAIEIRRTQDDDRRLNRTKTNTTPEETESGSAHAHSGFGMHSRDVSLDMTMMGSLMLRMYAASSSLTSLNGWT